MGFLAPAALALLALAIPIIALYLLKRRREEVTVSSTLLWQRLLRDVEANAPWQRLRAHLLLLLQLLALLALVLAAARPFVEAPVVSGRHVILLVDTSISMGARDEGGRSRLDEARQRALALFDALPEGGRATVVRAGGGADLLVAQAQSRQAVETALQSLFPLAPDSDMTTAVQLAAALAVRDRDAQIVLLSDGAIRAAPSAQRALAPLPFSFVPLGTSGENQAISAITVRPQGQGFALFVQVTHYGREPANRRLVVELDGRPFTALDLTLEPDEHAEHLFDLPADARLVRVRLDPPDLLPADDVAWAIATTPAPRSVRLVTTGNRFLQVALGLLPETTLTIADPPAPPPPAPPDLTVLDAGWTGEALPEGNVLLIAPGKSVEEIQVTGTISLPVPIPAAADDPLLRFVDLSDVAVLEAVETTLPDWARPVIVDANTGAPLLWTGERDGQRVALLAFDLHKSDLPLRTAFPILVANLVDELTRQPEGAGQMARLGEAVELTPPGPAGRAAVTAPDGSRFELTPERGAFSFVPNQVGVYEVRWEGVERPTLVAVNVLNPAESNVAPNRSIPLTGREAGTGAGRITGQRELWRWAAGIALVVLLLEWLVAYRPHLYATTPKARGR